MSRHDDSMGSKDVTPSIALRQMIIGNWISQLIYVVAKLGIADLMKDGPKRFDELAESVGTHASSLYRVMRALASVGVFTEVEDGRFGLTPIAACLQTGVQGSRRAMAIVYGEEVYRAWGSLLHSVRTGEPAFDHIFGMRFFQSLERTPEAARLFNEFMTELSIHENSAVVAEYDFSGIGTLVDVGGGHGAFIAAILHAYPKMRGVLFDLAHVIDGAKRRIKDAGIADRCELVAGDFFESVPDGGDAYAISRVIHDWDDDRATAILKNCRRAMTQSGKILVIEAVIPPGNAPFFGKLRDIQMLVLNRGGRERTEVEYRGLFASAGIRLTKVILTPSLVSVVEGVRA